MMRAMMDGGVDKSRTPRDNENQKLLSIYLSALRAPSLNFNTIPGILYNNV